MSVAPKMPADQHQCEDDRHPARSLGEKAAESVDRVEQRALAGVQRAEHRQAEQDVEGPSSPANDGLSRASLRIPLDSRRESSARG